LLLAGTLAGCNRQGPQQAAPPPPQVMIALPTPGKVTNYEEFTGHIEAVNSISVQAMVSGRLEKVLFKEGDLVKEGQPLFQIDPNVFQAQYDQTMANLALAQAHLKRLEADLRRGKALLPTKAISQEEYDKEEGDRNEAEATVKAAEAARNSAKVNLEYTTIRAKFAGRISRQMIDPGNMVKEKETALTMLVSTGKMYIYFDVDERTAIAIRKLIDEGKMSSPSGIAINYALADEEGYPRTANVNFVDNQINMATGTWRLRALIEQPDPCLLPNMFLRVRVPIGPPYDTLFVPERALGSDQGQKFLYVINGENKAEYRQIVYGPLREDMRAIKSGVGPKDRVVVTGLQRIKGGQVVDPQEEKKKVEVKKEDVRKEKQVAAQAVAPATPTAVR
jgi:RND family efflux transporter MFP subunit